MILFNKWKLCLFSSGATSTQYVSALAAPSMPNVAPRRRALVIKFILSRFSHIVGAHSSLFGAELS